MAANNTNWVTSFSKKKGRIYYFNVKTNESVWKKPPDLVFTGRDLEKLTNVLAESEEKGKDKTKTLKINRPVKPHRRFDSVASNGVYNVTSVPRKKIDLKERLQTRNSWNKKSCSVHERITLNVSKQPGNVYSPPEHGRKVQEDVGKSHISNNTGVDIFSTSLDDIIKYKQKIKGICDKTSSTKNPEQVKLQKKRRKNNPYHSDLGGQSGNCETSMEWEDIIEDSKNHVEEQNKIKNQQKESWFNFYLQKVRLNNDETTFDADDAIVLDTNVLLSAMKLINRLKDMPFDVFPAKFIVPYNVLNELDYLKMNKGNRYCVTQAAKQAINTLHDDLKNNHPRIIGQKVENNDNSDNPNTSTENDDLVINCCLQYQKLGYNVVLFTHDKNLISRALLNDIQSISSKELKEVCDIMDYGVEEGIQGMSGGKRRTAFGRTDDIPNIKLRRIGLQTRRDDSRSHDSCSKRLDEGAEDVKRILGVKETGLRRIAHITTNKRRKINCFSPENDPRPVDNGNQLEEDIEPRNFSRVNRPMNEKDEESEDSDMLLEDQAYLYFSSGVQGDTRITDGKRTSCDRTKTTPNDKQGSVFLQSRKYESGRCDNSNTFHSSTSHLDKDIEPGNVSPINRPLNVKSEESEDSDMLLEDEDYLVFSSDIQDPTQIASNGKRTSFGRLDAIPNDKQGEVCLQSRKEESRHGDSNTFRSSTSQLDKDIEPDQFCPSVKEQLNVKDDESEDSDMLLDDEDYLNFSSDTYNDSIDNTVPEKTIVHPKIFKGSPENADILVSKLKRALIYLFDNVIHEQSVFKDARLNSMTDIEATDRLDGLLSHLQLHWEKVTKLSLLEENITWILTLRKILLNPVEDTLWTKDNVEELMEAVVKVTDILKRTGVNGIIKNNFTLVLLDCQDVEYQLKKEIFVKEIPVRKVGTMTDLLLAQEAFNISWHVVNSVCDDLSSRTMSQKQNPGSLPETDEVLQIISMYYNKVSDILDGLNGVLYEDVENLSMFHPSIQLLYNTLLAIVPDSSSLTLQSQNSSNYEAEEQYFICDLTPRCVLAYCIQQENRSKLISAKDSFARFLNQLSKSCDDYLGV